MLLGYGADPRQCSTDNNSTALMLAAESLCVGTAQLLAIFGSDLSAQQYGGLHQGVQPPDVIPPKTALRLVSSKHPVAGDQIPSQDAMMS